MAAGPVAGFIPQSHSVSSLDWGSPKSGVTRLRQTQEDTHLCVDYIEHKSPELPLSHGVGRLANFMALGLQLGPTPLLLGRGSPKFCRISPAGLTYLLIVCYLDLVLFFQTTAQ